MPRRLPSALLVALSCAAPAALPAATPDFREFDQPPHDYFRRPPTDRFTRVLPDLASGRVPLDRGSETGFLRDLLAFLEIPVSSQMLVFSTTSLQLSRISPSNPRALYFSDDLYLGYIPGGRLEVVSLDRDLGAVFYIFDLPRGPGAITAERSTRCMNCHAGGDTGHVPGLAVKSVAPAAGGGSLDAFRREQSGHGIPFEERFGGWYVTGEGSLTNHWGNAIGRYVDGSLRRLPNRPEGRFGPDRYLLPSSDVLPQLVHEHQVGFVNRVVEATYRTRTLLAAAQGPLGPAAGRELDEQAEIVTRYLLFADEVRLPEGGLAGDPGFRADFLRKRRAVGGVSLRDFDLRTRLFRHRCSYMIYSPVFEGLPRPVKERIHQRLARILDPERSEPGFEYLPADEKRTIRRILEGTLEELPAEWTGNKKGAPEAGRP